MSKVTNEAGTIEIHNKLPKERKEKASLLFTRLHGGEHDGCFELKLDFENGSVTTYLDPKALADMLGHSMKNVDVFVQGSIDSSRKPKILEFELRTIPKKFIDATDYTDRDNILKYPRLRDYMFAAMKTAGIKKAVVSFSRSNTPANDEIIVREIY